MNKQRYLLLLCLLFSGLTASGQNKRLLDSLQRVYDQKTTDTGRFDALTDLIAQYRLGNAVKAMELCKQQVELAGKIGQPGFTGKALFNLAIQQRKEGNYEEAVRTYMESLKNFESIGDELNAGNVYGSLGITYWQEGNLEFAIQYLRKSLVIMRKHKKKYNTLSNLNNIGGIFFEQKKYDSALVYLQQSIHPTEEIKDTAGLGDIYVNLGATYLLQNKLPEAIAMSHKGIYYARISGNEYALQTGYSTLGGTSAAQFRYPEAVAYFDSSNTICLKLNAREALKANYKSLADIYVGAGNFEKAYYFQKQYADIKDSLLSEANLKQINEMDAKYQSSRKDKALLEEQTRSDKKTIIIYAAAAGLALLLVLLFFIYRSFRIKQKSEAEITKQKAIIEEQNKEILDSIHYAERIQQSLLPPEPLRLRLLPSSFVYYQPRSIVAGDFYWMNEQQEHLIFAVADCTGHGVPGALMSVVCGNALNRTVNEYGITDPGKILDKVRELVIASFGTGTHEVNDGMDISLCCWHAASRTMQWAGANNPLWYIRNNTMHELKGDKQPVGRFAHSKPFTTHTLQVEAGDRFYLFSDGYADQFGGSDGKKFKYRQLKDLLLEGAALSPEKQAEVLRNTFMKWKGSLEQIDDVCIMGVQLV
jgi:serine phosphatase RsbU (regulator of sigma subunit)